MHYDRVGGCITTEWGDALRQSGGMHYDRVGGMLTRQGDDDTAGGLMTQLGE